MDRRQSQVLVAQGIHVLDEAVHLFLQSGHVGRHLLELVRVLKGVGAAVRRVRACQVEVAASLTGRLAIALDLAAFALVAANGGFG